MKAVRIHVGLLLASVAWLSADYSAARGQKPAPQSKPSRRAGVKEVGQPRTLPAEVSALIDHARAAPPEFAADALIRIALSPLVPDPGRKRDLLEEAFRTAANAQQPFKRDYVGGDVDTREGYLSYAMDLRLDGLSLRARAVRAMLPLDAKRARALFGEVPPRLPLEPLGCEDALTYDLADFYAALSEVVNKSFGPEERRREEDVRFLEPYVTGMTSPAQVPHVAGVLLSLQASPPQFDLLTLEFGGALKNVHEDDRSFSASLWRDSLIRRVEELMEENEKRGLSKLSLTAALRTYLVRNLTGRRCEDNVGEGRQKMLFNQVNFFNKSLSEKTISAEEIKPGRVEGTYKTQGYWRTEAAARLLADFKALRFSSGSTQYTAAEKLSPGWRQKLAKFLNDLGDWSGEGEELEEDYFHQKSVLYEALTEVVPPGPARDGVVAAYVTFLRDNGLKRGSRVEWFLHANHLIAFARKSQGDARMRTLAALKNSGDVVLGLYGELETFTPAMKQGTD